MTYVAIVPDRYVGPPVFFLLVQAFVQRELQQWDLSGVNNSELLAALSLHLPDNGRLPGLYRGVPERVQRAVSNGAG